MALRIAFVRPRLGMGGAERLVVDAARALGERGHTVAVFAPDRASIPQFDNVRSPLFSWRRDGGWIPESVLGRLRAPMSLARGATAGFLSVGFKPDVVIADVTSHIVPSLARWTRVPVIFYCHFPDALLTREGSRSRSSYRAYRRWLDGLEARGLDAARAVLVNSAFTAKRLAETFPELRREVEVLPPGVDVSRFPADPVQGEGKIAVVAISRFDPRKNLLLAVEAFAAARREAAPDSGSRMALHIAGRYDERWPECREALGALKDATARLGLVDAVHFHLSPDDSTVRDLLAKARAVLYTPRGEHFGYGPLEAMASARPVIAVNDGGPAETVRDGATGFLCPASATHFAAALSRFVVEPELAKRFGHEGRKRVEAHYSLDRFGAGLERVCLTAAARR